jgi:hypothetical protein
MLALAFGLLCGAALIGGVLVVCFLNAARPAPTAVALAHAVLGTAGLAALLLALRHGLPRTGFGTAGFAPAATALLALALALGVLLANGGLRRRRAAVIIVATHAGLAITGLVLVLAILALP